ncbi:hypothetical protein PYW08_010821 [Mythimna loreyi]|uniref:Uncharacterized protein n=1 Tax=Mythimna loreyi TaxID=667449 RepID=A0ACC2Q1H2_9NEOP|nr:hypothetical protein PYW08_010821 [Mythimna loreyi]
MNFALNRPDRRAVFSPTHYSIANYSTETKKEMRTTFAEELFLANNLHFIPDPLMKNLADSIITEEKMAPKSKLNTNNIDVKTNEDNMEPGPDYSPLSGITNFFSGVMNVITSAMFSKRKQCDSVAQPGGQMALPPMWHGAKILDQNKILQDEHEKSSELLPSEMTDVKKAAAHCQNKIEQVRLLLSSKPVPCNFRARRRPKRVFVEASSVEDSFEDAFSPEDFENIASDSFIEYSSPVCYHDHVFHEIDGPKTKTEMAKTAQNIPETPTPTCETTEIVKNVPEIETANESNNLVCDMKPEVVATCEDKLSKLKALLQERKNKKSKPIVEPEPFPEPEPIRKPVNVPELPKPKTKVKDKKFKNPNRTCSKRMKSKMRKSIQDDLQFANEIIIEDASSAENSPSLGCLDKFIAATKPEKEYFDEVSGRFLPGSVTESEDSFQIVFNDCPKPRRTSDCESEDSFIVFEDSPDSCYTSNDVFGETSDSEDYDSDSDMSDSGCGYSSFNLAASLSKSVCNLADDSLYEEQSEDEVDCANVRHACESVDLDTVEPAAEKTGLLLDDRKKLLRKALPSKKVHFSEQPPKVHVMRVWSFAARQARAGHWERYALDRERFKRRIADVDVAVSWVLKPQHRSRVMFQRFMPWWNAQKRKELAEKKEREALDKLQKEEEASRIRQNEEDLLSPSEDQGNIKECLNSTEEKNTDSKVLENGEVFKNNVNNDTGSKKISSNDKVPAEIIPINDKVFDLKSDFKQVLDT